MKKSTFYKNCLLFLLITILLISCTPTERTLSVQPIITSTYVEVVITDLPSETETKIPQNTPTPKPEIKTDMISGRAVYSLWVSQDPITSQIFVKDLDSGEITQLTNSGNNSNPKWSPDGSRILYLSRSDENYTDIYLMDKNGDHQEPLVTTPALEFNPNWSPDGKKFVFDSNMDGNYEIYMMDLQTREISRLTYRSDYVDSSPFWSPDGSKIVFVSGTGTSGKSQLFVMNTDGTDITAITEFDKYYEEYPIWHPDGSCVFFTRLIGQPAKIMELDFSNNRITQVFSEIFPAESMEFILSRTQHSNYLTFSMNGKFYAFDINTRETYPLGIEARNLSLFTE